MKVLWFTNTPCSSTGRDGRKIISGGWLSALEQELRAYPDIHLEIAFLSSEPSEGSPFVYEGVKYYPIKPYSAGSYLGFRLRRLTMSRRGLQKAVVARMKEIVEESAPDIIHIHGTEKPFGHIAEHVKDIPVVYSIQGIVSACVEKFFAGIPRNEVARHESLLCRLQKKSAIRDFRLFAAHAGAEQQFLKSAKYIIGRTEWDKRIAAGLLGRSAKYFHIDEIMRQQFYASQWSKAAFSSPLRIVSVLSYGTYKGFETLLKAAALLKENGGFNFEWLVIGYDGKEEYVRISEKVTGLSPASCNVRFIGRKNAEEMACIMCGCDIFCHVSHIDNSPNSVCEAMLLGMPVIASFAGGVSSIVEDGTDGILVQDGDPYGLAGTLCAMQNDFGWCRTLGVAARERALRRNNPQKVATDTIAAYSCMLNEKNSR